MKENNVYTIGSYEAMLTQGKTVAKLGPLPADKVPPIFPKSFLEADGSYGGGEAFDSIEKAEAVLNSQLSSGILPQDQQWFIYLLEANFQTDTYELRQNDFRLKNPVKVLGRVSNEIPAEVSAASSSPRPGQRY